MANGLKEIKMRIDRINLSTDQDEQGNVRSASVWFENANELGERINGNFGITIDQYSKITNKEMTIREIAEAKIIELFEITIDQDSMAGVVELRKKLEEKDNQIKDLLEKLEEQTGVMTELALMLSQVGTNEETNDENTNPNPDETGGEGGE